MSDPRIHTGIPWLPNRRLGEAVNLFMSCVPADDWALILDWDVALVNIHWYDLCLSAINRSGPDVGLISCMTNRIGCPLQKAGDAPAGDDLDEHRAYALARQLSHLGRLDDITAQERWWLSGFFLLIPRRAWNEIAPAPEDKFLGFDNWVHQKIRAAGRGVLLMQDLYCYHGYKRQWKTDGSIR
jgi:GT2 family glycosyltransferase